MLDYHLFQFKLDFFSYKRKFQIKDEIATGRKNELTNGTDMDYRDEHDENSRFQCVEQTLV